MNNRKEKTGNNQAHLAGRLVSDFEFSHKVEEECYYKALLCVPRLSGTEDTIPVIFPEHVIRHKEGLQDRPIRIEGEFRSRQTYEEGHSRLYLFVMARNIFPANGYADYNLNDVYLDGFLCREPVFRVTPLGREICDIVVAVKRLYKKSYHIPCILWGSNARLASELQTGTAIKIWGRIQSRDYTKWIEEDQILVKTAYEVSVNHMRVDMEDVFSVQNVGEAKVKYKRGNKNENHTGKRDE